MNTQVNRTPQAVSAWLHLQRAREAVNRAAAELPRAQLGPQARQQYALELAELMGKIELLLSTLRRQASDDRQSANHQNPVRPAHQARREA